MGSEIRVTQKAVAVECADGSRFYSPLVLVDSEGAMLPVEPFRVV